MIPKKPVREDHGARAALAVIPAKMTVRPWTMPR
jgi:hypothetical protein